MRPFWDFPRDGICVAAPFRSIRCVGLGDLNWAPHRHPNQTPVVMEGAMLELRQAHMGWGPRKLKRRLERDWPGREWPTTSTIGEIIKRAGLVSSRKKRRKTEPYSQSLAHAVESNRLWCEDFKGWFKAGEKPSQQE